MEQKKNNPPVPFFHHCEELGELDEEHTLHICQKMRKKYQEASW